MNDDYRKLKRRKTELTVQVIDAMTQQLLGTISDLSESGMMIVAKKAIAPDGLYQFELIFPLSTGIAKPINVGAHELWTESSAIDGVTVAGFRFIDISRDDKTRLRDWVNEPGSRYA